MSEENKKDAPGLMGRRGFLRVVGVAAAVPLAASSGLALAQDASSSMAMDMPATSGPAPAADAGTPASAGYQFFNTDEASFIETAIDTLIPHDDTGPGALELGVNIYIDRQMAGAYGKGDRMWLNGPYAQGVPTQGWQYAMTPSEFIRAGIRDIDAYAQSSQGDFFSSLTADKRVALLKEVETGKAKLDTVPPAAWFGEFYELVVEGYFGDPLYGGNKGKAAWDMIGFPGADAMYMDKIEPFRNKPYTVAAKSIQDLI